MLKEDEQKKWEWTKSIREEIYDVAEDLREDEKKASGSKLQEIQLKLHLLKECFDKLGNVKFP